MNHLTTHKYREYNYLRAYKAPSTFVENPLQIDLFMQNKPNFQDTQMNVSIYLQTAYENKRDWTLGQNKPNSNPISEKPK